MPMQVAVIGAGSWGTTVAHLCAQQRPHHAVGRAAPTWPTQVRDDHRNEQYLPGFELHPSLHATADLAEAVAAADVLVMGVPSHGMRATALRARAATCGRGCRW